MNRPMLKGQNIEGNTWSKDKIPNKIPYKNSKGQNTKDTNNLKRKWPVEKFTI